MSEPAHYITWVDIRIWCHHEDDTETHLWSDGTAKEVTCPDCGRVFLVPEVEVTVKDGEANG